MPARKRVVSSLLLVCSALVVVSLLGACNSSRGAYYIGAPDVALIREPIELALGEINACGGIGGRPLRAVFVGSDDGLPPAQAAVAIADRLARDPRILAVVGHVTSAESLPAAHIYNRYEVVNLVPNSTNPLVAHVGPFIFRICANDDAQGRYLAEVALSELGGRSIGVIFVNDDYGKLLARAFLDRLAELGAECRYIGWYDGQGTVELELVVEQLRAAGCDLVFFTGSPPQLVRMLELFRDSELSLTVLCGDGSLNIESAAAVMDVRGDCRIFVTSFYNPNLDEPEGVRFRQAYVERFGQDPESVSALSYDAVFLLAEAMSSAGANREMIRRYIGEVGGSRPVFRGVTGTIRIFRDGECRRRVSVLAYEEGMPALSSAIVAPPGRQGGEGSEGSER